MLIHKDLKTWIDVEKSEERPEPNRLVFIAIGESKDPYRNRWKLAYYCAKTNVFFKNKKVYAFVRHWQYYTGKTVKPYVIPYY